MLQFLRHLLAMPLPWRLWVGALVAVNLGALLFLPRVEAWVVLGGIALSALIQTALFARLGFVRLLGLGHTHWIPMVTWLLLRLDAASGERSLQRWMIAVIAFCALSLVIDIADVVRYLRGERQPTVVLRTERPRSAATR